MNININIYMYIVYMVYMRENYYFLYDLYITFFKKIKN